MWWSKSLNGDTSAISCRLHLNTALVQLQLVLFPQDPLFWAKKGHLRILAILTRDFENFYMPFKLYFITFII